MRWNEGHLAVGAANCGQQRTASRHGGVDGEGWHAQRIIENNSCLLSGGLARLDAAAALVVADALA